MDIYPYVTRMSFNHLIISAIINDFSNPFWGNSMKIPLPVCLFGIFVYLSICLSYQYVHLGKPCLLIVRVTEPSLSNALVKIKFTVIRITIWHHRQNWHSSMLYRVHAIHIQYFWYPKYLISGYKMFNQLPFLHVDHWL